MAAEPQFKLALRNEGRWYVAYVMPIAGDGKGAELGRISIGLMDDDVLREKFLELSQLAVEVAMKELGFSVDRWGKPRDAPEGERSGNA